jgi:large subunit ribosomal protein L25
MARKELTVEPRQITGKKVAQLRRSGILPGNVFGHGIQSVAVQVQTEVLEHTLKTAVANEVIDLKVGSGTVHPVVIHKIQRNPLNGSFLHADFYQVRLREKMRADVPLQFHGTSEAVETYNGVLLTTLDAVQVEALPLDLPSHIDVDISVLRELEQSIHVGALTVPSNVTILTDPDLVVIKVASPRVEEEEEAPEAEEAAEVTAEAEAEAEGEAPAAEAKEEESSEEK